MVQAGRATLALPGRQITTKSKLHSSLALLILIIVLTIDHNTIQKLFLTGNLTYLNLTKPQLYPASEFGVAATGPASYEIQVLFDSQGDYTVNLFVVNQDSGLTRNATTYYFSGGPFELDINATFSPRPNETATVVPPQPPMQSFAEWVGSSVKHFHFG